ncbi:MAG: colicin V production protein [Acidocella sp. 20-57-95]|nr:MAG: colicin V production protein [Acidocella sp. 20-57-95]OYV58862.1 MAG: colicin V production protein [Acidocella sp. 21-58-7]HQT62974.1 CvpA family protein [Acidocella sp.]HQU05040.1 CvpA family protein [Acidocella sp.]
MTWVDGVAIGIVVLSAIFSLVRGFVREVLAVFAWLGAIFVALKSYGFVQPYVDSVLPAKNLVVPLSIGVVFIVVLIVLSIISAWIGGMVRDSSLSGLDRSLGLVFGTARGVAIICLGYIGLSMFVIPNEWPLPVLNSRVLPYAYQGASALAGLLPKSYQPNVLPIPTPATPSAGALMQQPVAGSALRQE